MSEPIKVTGLIEVSFGTAMREPVTTTSWSAGSVLAVVAAGAVCAFATPNDATNELPVSAARTANRSRGFPE